MSREEWAELEPLLDQLLELPDEERATRLAELRARTPALAAQLEALLAADLSSDIGVPPGAAESLAGQSIGNYTLIRPIGHGGMGTVWLGHRHDGRFEGEAAIKLLNLALIGRAGEERFAQEGRVLSRLTHPNIARLLDAGVTAGGQPYLVLEYIDGERIDQFVNRNRFPVDRRIELFLEVLDGVASAHANLVVHRDIKPSNIMVTAAGDVKLLDFGIAKMLTEGRGTAGASSITAHDGRALTPEYAAPEQIRGEPVSTATDVYSLGVLLYLMLGGTHPTGEGCHTPVEHLRAAMDTEPTRLSDVVVTGGSKTRDELERIAAARGATPERLQRLLLGDLDNILAKALKKLPAERYQTVAALRDDLERYLRHQPVSARPDSLAYRTRKFIRRNRTSVIAAAIAALSLIGGTTVAVHQMEVARNERDRATAALKRAHATTAFQGLIFRLIEPEGQPLTYRQLLDKGRLALDKEFRADPVSRMEVGIQFAQNYLREDDAMAADTVIRRTVAIADSIGAPLWQGRTRCELSFAYSKRGVADSALALAAEGRAYLERVRNLESVAAEACDGADGDALMVAKRFDSAAVMFARATDRFRADRDTLTDEYSYAINSYARALFSARRVRDARPIVLQILEMVHAGSDPDPVGLRVVQFNAGQAWESLGELVGRRDFLRREIALTEEPGVVLLFDYAVSQLALEQPDSAAFWFRRALETPDLLDDARGYVAHVRLAQMARRGGRIQEADSQESAAAKLYPATSRSPLARAVIGAARIRSLLVRTDPGARSQLIRQTLDSLGYKPDAQSRFLIEPLAAAAEVLLDAGVPAEAARYAAAILRIAQLDSLTPTQSGMVGMGLLLEARAERGQGHNDRARDLALRAIPPLAYGMGPGHSLTRSAVALRDSLAVGHK